MVAAIALAAMVAGCGGDNGGASAETGAKTYSVEANTTVTTTSISKGRFISRVNQTCREAWVIILDNYRVHSSTQDPKLSKRERFAEAIRLSVLAGIDFHIFDNIRFLGAPRGEAREVEEIIGPMQFAVEQGQQGVHVTSIARLSSLFTDFNQRAHQYGLDDCLVNASHLGKIET
jgi:hypothetical protein